MAADESDNVYGRIVASNLGSVRKILEQLFLEPVQYKLASIWPGSLCLRSDDIDLHTEHIDQDEYLLNGWVAGTVVEVNAIVERLSAALTAAGVRNSFETYDADENLQAEFRSGAVCSPRVIERDQMFPPLLEACPTFTPNWQEFVDEWRGDDGSLEDLPHYVALAEFARHLISMLVRSETSSFPAVFSVVEDLHTQGDPYVREAATIGLLESLQNTNLHDKTDPEAFRPWLHPVTREYWDKVHGFWSRGEFTE